MADTAPARRTFDWMFRDGRTNRVVMGQFPNLPLLLAVALFSAWWSVDALDGPSWLYAVFDLGFAATMVWWAVLEIARGVNPWRRLLGGAGLLLVVGGRVPG